MKHQNVYQQYADFVNPIVLSKRETTIGEAEDWVIATGVTTTVRAFVSLAFEEVEIDLEFKGEDEKA